MNGNGQALRQQTKDLAGFVTNLAKQSQDELNKLHNTIRQQNEVIAGLVRAVGRDLVQSAMNEMRDEAKAELLKKQVEGVKTMVEKGILVPSEFVEQPGFIVGTDEFADGSEKRVQFETATLNPEFQTLYIGKKVGDVIQGAKGTKLHITEVYRIDQAAADKLMESDEAAEAAKKAAAQPAADAEPAKTEPAPQ